MLKRIIKLSSFLAFVVFLCFNIQAQILNLTDENTIGLTLDRFKKAIQKTDTLQVFTILGNQVLIKGEILDPRCQVRSIFEKAGNRKTVISPPLGAEDRKFWDLEFTNFNVAFAKDSTEALVTCKLKLWGAKTDMPRSVKQTPESFQFKKNGKEWSLVGFENLLDFLWEEVSTSEKD
jgi:hypothetical protein